MLSHAEFHDYDSQGESRLIQKNVTDLRQLYSEPDRDGRVIRNDPDIVLLNESRDNEDFTFIGSLGTKGYTAITTMEASDAHDALMKFMASCYNETRNHVKEAGITVIHQYNTPAKKVKYGIITADSEIIDLS